MKQHYFFPLIVSLFFFFSSVAQNSFSISGIVLSDNSLPLKGVSVLINKGKGTDTNGKGAFTISGLSSGIYTL